MKANNHILKKEKGILVQNCKDLLFWVQCLGEEFHVEEKVAVFEKQLDEAKKDDGSEEALKERIKSLSKIKSDLWKVIDDPSSKLAARGDMGICACMQNG